MRKTALVATLALLAGYVNLNAAEIIISSPASKIKSILLANLAKVATLERETEHMLVVQETLPTWRQALIAGLSGGSMLTPPSVVSVYTFAPVDKTHTRVSVRTSLNSPNEVNAQREIPLSKERDLQLLLRWLKKKSES